MGTPTKTGSKNTQMLLVLGVVAAVVVVFVVVMLLNNNQAPTPAEAADPEAAAAVEETLTDDQRSAAETLGLDLPVILSRYANIETSVSEDGVPQLGDADAPVVVANYFAFSCGHCANFHDEQFPALLADEIPAGEVRFQAISLPGNAISTLGSIAAYCADELDGKFWEMHDALFTMFRTVGAGMVEENNVLLAAIALGLDRDAFSTCYTGTIEAIEAEDVTGSAVLSRLEASLQLWAGLQSEYPGEITGTPTLTFNGEPPELLAGANTRSGAREIEYIRERIAALGG